jgi:uncharacterized protein (DUF433 family)
MIFNPSDSLPFGRLQVPFGEGGRDQALSRIAVVALCHARSMTMEAIWTMVRCARYRAKGGELLSELHRITVDLQQCGGRPCIRSLRIRVKDVLDLLAAGASRNEILEDYPYLEDADISAALEYAARQSDHPVLHVA